MIRVRIFISSPADVAQERECAAAVVENLQSEFDDELTLEALLWEQEPLLASADFQSQIRSPKDFEIFATIIGARLGSPLSQNFTRTDGSTYASGTEFEFEQAMAGFRANGKPELLVYRKAPAGNPIDTDPAQVAAVNAFFDKWFLSATDGTALGAYHTFAQPQQFERIFTLHLRKLLRRFMPRPNNLPTPFSSFVGRQQLIADIQQALRAGATRLVALTGPGGTGKSRLALRSAQTLLPEFDDGVFYVPLAALREPDLVPNSIATVLNIKPTDDATSMLDRVCTELRDSQLLLVIDNLEQVQAATSHISSVLRACPGVKALITSRTAPRVSGAHILRVPPFALPPLGSDHQSIASSESVELFVARARDVRPDFELTQANSTDVLHICHRLDGLPLAIELATSRLRSMDLSRLLHAMEKRFAVLKGGADDLLDHQRSLRELINWSYELLTADEQSLWRRLAVFVGGCTMEAAEAVCDPDDEFVVDIEIEALADHSLVSIDFHNGSDPRINMLDTLREFALDKLRESGEFDRIQQEFCAWCTRLAAASEPALLGADASRWLSRLTQEHHNLQGALEHLYVQQSQTPQLSAPTVQALTIASNLWFYWFEHGYLDSARDWLQQATKDVPGLPDTVRANALKGLAAIARFQNDLDQAEQHSHAALALFEQLGDVAGQAKALSELGATAQRRGDLDEAARRLDASLALYEGVSGDLHGRSFTCTARGVVNHLQGDLAGARAYYQQALDIGGESGDTDSIASALVNMGELAEAEHDIEAAYRYYTDSLQMFYARGKKVAIAYCAEVLAGLDVKFRGNAADAALIFGFADCLRTEIAAPIEPFNAARLQNDLELTRNALPADTFAAAWQTGAALEVDEFIAFVGARSRTAEVH